MLIETLRAWPRENIDLCQVDWTQRLPRIEFVRAYEFMRWCRKDDFRLEQLCDFLGSSEERFNRLFRATIQASPAQFFNRMLLERSRILLQNPGSVDQENPLHPWDSKPTAITSRLFGASSR